MNLSENFDSFKNYYLFLSEKKENQLQKNIIFNLLIRFNIEIRLNGSYRYIYIYRTMLSSRKIFLSLSSYYFYDIYEYMS
jgi:hypothetical protein